MLVKRVNQIYISDKIKRYIVELVFATRSPKAQGFSKLENLIEHKIQQSKDN